MNKQEYIKKWSVPKTATLNNVSNMFQFLVRIYQTDENGGGNCVTCGKELELKTTNCQAGHFIQREIYKYRLDFDNCHLQCSYCNKYLSGNINSYTIFMKNKYGIEKVNEMQQYYRNIKFGLETQKKPRQKEIKEKYDLFVYLIRELKDGYYSK
jgi:hypothetical protein